MPFLLQMIHSLSDRRDDDQNEKNPNIFDLSCILVLGIYDTCCLYALASGMKGARDNF